MKAHQKSIGQNDEWLTPPWVLDPLGDFDLDPCAPVSRPWSTARRHYTINDDGLTQPWFGRVWLNPPFNRFQRGQWMKRMADHGNGIMLIPAALETAAAAKYVWGKSSGLLFLSRRPHFHFVDGLPAKANSGCTIALVAYGKYNAQVLAGSGLGYFVEEAQPTGEESKS